MERSVRKLHVSKSPERVTSPGTVSPKDAGLMRTRRVRNYSRGNIPEMIARIKSLKDLKKAVTAISQLHHTKTISKRALKRAQAAVDAKRAELQSRLVVSPEDVSNVKESREEKRTEGGLYLP